MTISRPEFILVQNPPAVPTLLIVRLVCLLRRTKMVVDWHNFGYTIMALSLGQKSILVRLAYWYERIVGRTAHAHFCVTRALQHHLITQWKFSNVTVLYDRAPASFGRCSIRKQSELFDRLHRSGVIPADPFADRPCGDGETLVTAAPAGAGDGVVPRVDRPALIMSSTSWTPDGAYPIPTY